METTQWRKTYHSGIKVLLKTCLASHGLVIIRKVKVYFVCSFCEAAKVTECWLSCTLTGAEEFSRL